MGNRSETRRATAVGDAELGRSQAIFVAVGLVIVLGGLWLLYQSDGPYHPEVPITDT